MEAIDPRVRVVKRHCAPATFPWGNECEPTTMSNEPTVVYATSKKYATNGDADARSFVSSYSPSHAGVDDRRPKTLTSLQATSWTNNRRTQTRSRTLRHDPGAFTEMCRKKRLRPDPRSFITV